MKKITFIILSLFSPLLFAITLGELKVYSEPDEKLEAKIYILDSSFKNNYKVGLASAKEFELAGIPYNPEVRQLKWEVVTLFTHEPYIYISSKTPLKSERLPFILKLRTRDASILRQYEILQVGDDYRAYSKPAVMIEVEEQKKSKKIKKEIREEEEIEEVRENKKISYYYVKNGTNLWHVVQEVKENYDAEFYQIMAGIAKANPSAFINSNINQLMAGSTLLLPTQTYVEEWSEARARYYIGNRLAQAAKQTGIPSPATMAAVAKPAMLEAQNKPTETPAELNLRILAPKTAEQLSSEQAKLGENMALVNESLEQVQRENENMRTRVQALQSQIAALEKMIELRKKAGENAGAISTEPMIQTPSQPTAVELSTTGWAAMSQLWTEITKNKWMYYLVLSLGILAIILVIISFYLVYRVSKTDKAVKAMVDTTPYKNKPTADLPSAKKNKTTSKESEGDKVAVKLELAKAYNNLGDRKTTTNLLKEVMAEGNEAQRKAAQELMEKLN